jgi:hypothetical protein
MKSQKLLLAFLCLVFTSLKIHAQSVKIAEGDISALKGEKEINVEFTYDSMSVGKYEKESDFVAYKKVQLNKAEAGRGDTWAVKWVDDRSYKFEPKFIETFQNYSQMQAGQKKNSKYTIIFHTTFTEPGFSAGWPVRKSAEIRGEAIVVETANRSHVLGKLTIEKAKGSPYGGFDFDTGVRITDAYGEAGKGIGKFIKDKI